jgi:cation transport ATPase
VLFSEIVGFEHPELMEHLPKPIAKDPKQLVLWLAACDEKQSEHPLGKAVVNAAISICGADVTRSEDGVEVSDFEVRVAPGNMAFSSVSVATSSLLLRAYTKPTILVDGSFEKSNGWLAGISQNCRESS